MRSITSSRRNVLMKARVDPDQCAHPPAAESRDIITNEIYCADCGLLRDMMPWDEWERLDPSLKADPHAHES